MPPLTVFSVPLVNLKGFNGNARTHTRSQITQVAKSIESFGFTNPILIDRNNEIIAGHCRFEALKELGWESAPCICLNLTEKQKRVYVIADNQLALNAGWDLELLNIELNGIITDGEVDPVLTGFTSDQINKMLEGELSTEQETDPFIEEESKKLILEFNEEQYEKIMSILNNYKNKNNITSDSEAVFQIINSNE